MFGGEAVAGGGALVWRSSGPYRAAVLEQEDNESENVRHVGSSAPAGEESPPAAESLIKKLTPELLELVIESAMPGQGPLVPAMHEPPPTTLAPPDAFRVFVHVRPLEFGNGSLGGACSEHALQTMKREHIPSPRKIPSQAGGGSRRPVRLLSSGENGVECAVCQSRAPRAVPGAHTTHTRVAH